MYLPLVARKVPAPDGATLPGTWITVLAEGFEAAPDPLWQFIDDNGTSFGAYIGVGALPAVHRLLERPGSGRRGGRRSSCVRQRLP